MKKEHEITIFYEGGGFETIYLGENELVTLMSGNSEKFIQYREENDIGYTKKYLNPRSVSKFWIEPEYQSRVE